jgi:hypothetical protein
MMRELTMTQMLKPAITPTTTMSHFDSLEQRNTEKFGNRLPGPTNKFSPAVSATYKLSHPTP